jgi:hypothetical protein
LEEQDQEFTGMDEVVMRKVVDILVKDGKAAVFSSGSGNIGVKFI